MRKVILYIAMSLDGYIAKHDGDISFLFSVEKEGEDYGYARFMEHIDTVVLGHKTYQKVLSMGYEAPYGERDVYIYTRTPRPDKGKMQFFVGNLPDLIGKLKAGAGKDIFIDGGADTVHELLKHRLIDECYVSIIPVLLGEGITLFQEGRTEQKLQLLTSQAFEKGLVQLHYACL
jgi:dihydrofolate reductase